jgi:hypothetical protein
VRAGPKPEEQPVINHTRNIPSVVTNELKLIRHIEVGFKRPNLRYFPKPVELIVGRVVERI